MSYWTCKNCGLRFFAVDNPLPRVEQCPRCGEALGGSFVAWLASIVIIWFLFALIVLWLKF